MQQLLNISLFGVFPIAYCLLPIAYCLLPIAYCLLPIAYCLCLAGCIRRPGCILPPNAYCLRVACVEMRRESGEI